MRSLLLWLLLSLSLPLASAMGDRPPEIIISIHREGEAMETGEFVLPYETPSGERHFRKMPEFTQNYIQAYKVVDTAHGQAVALQLDPAGTMRLSSLSTQQQGQGKYLLVAINGQAREFHRIDAAVDDGIIILWGGMTPQELAALDKQVKRNGKLGG